MDSDRRLSPDGQPPEVESLIDSLAASGEDVALSLHSVIRLGGLMPLPGGGSTAQRWDLLARVAAADLTAARILEAHCDALAILAEAGEPVPTGSWGVFAAEDPSVVLTATQEPSGWSITGTKAWCSLAGALDNALISAHSLDGRRLFGVALKGTSVQVAARTAWVARGLRRVPSSPVHFAATSARPVGTAGWYLTRPGFAWGGIGVASCWYGGAVGLASSLHATAGAATELGQVLALQLGRVDVALSAAAAVLREAAARVDQGLANGRQGELLAYRVRAIVADAVELTLNQVGHALGPGPLAFDEDYARRTADLELYVRQHHGERDVALLGAAVAREAG